jgi:hypothetical protein
MGVVGIFHENALRRSNEPSPRLPWQSTFAPSGRCTGYSSDAGTPRPTRSRMTMTGSRFPGSRVVASDHLPRAPMELQWFAWSSAIRLQLRGQPRICPLGRTHRIPLNSPCGHYRSHNWHPRTGGVNKPPLGAHVPKCRSKRRDAIAQASRGPQLRKKDISLDPSGKTPLRLRAIPAQEGRSYVVTDRGPGCGGRGSVGHDGSCRAGRGLSRTP